MVPVAPTPAEEQTPQDSNSRPWCSRCGTDEFLLIESVDESFTEPGQLLAVSYTCLECDNFYAHDVPIGSLNPGVVYEYSGRPPIDAEGQYVHCGEPMTRGSTVRHTVASAFVGNVGEKHRLEVYLRTRVLHCRCGFQMEIPRQEQT